jgi:hypothetical protein
MALSKVTMMAIITANGKLDKYAKDKTNAEKRCGICVDITAEESLSNPKFINLW